MVILNLIKNTFLILTFFLILFTKVGRNEKDIGHFTYKLAAKYYRVVGTGPWSWPHFWSLSNLDKYIWNSLLLTQLSIMILWILIWNDGFCKSWNNWWFEKMCYFAFGLAAKHEVSMALFIGTVVATSVWTKHSICSKLTLFKMVWKTFKVLFCPSPPKLN